MRKYLFIFFITNLVCAQNSVEKLKIKADSLFDAGNYFDAITEYKRLEFFDSNTEFNFISNFKMGICYKNGARFENALKAFAKAQLNALTDEEKIAVKEEIVKVNILRRTTNQAHFFLDELGRIPSYNKNNLYYWRGWAYMFEDKWDLAAVEFGKIRANHELKILAEGVNSDKYSVTLAKVISYILPGGGQFYTGNFLSGIMSLGWNALWGYTTINAFLQDRVFDGLMVGNLLWLRFYRGNYQNAEKFAEQKNIDIINEAYRYLQNSYKGLKP